VTLVDTSVWIDHLRQGSDLLLECLHGGDVLTHPFVVGELALGSMRNRAEIMSLLRSLPGLPVAEHDEVLALVENRQLAGTGIGWVDAHLLASALMAGARIFTADRPLQKACRALGIAGP
jgi:predicted nucleic acid-binding protein